MESRSRASPEQFVALLEFMESHGDLSRPQQGPQGRFKGDRMWQELVELLNSIGGGVLKSMEKWKKVWADLKAKTKKKGLAIRREASGTGGGPSSRQTLTALEERVLAIIGLTAVTGQARIEERGFDAPPSERNSPPLPIGHSDCTVGPSQVSATDEIINFFPSYSVQATTASSAPPTSPPPSEESARHLPPPVVTQLPGHESVPTPSAMSPTASTSRGAQRRRRRRASPSPAASPAPATPRRRELFQTRARRIQSPFERSTDKFVAVELGRQRLEDDRDKRYHERETERLRLESRRIDMEDNRNQILSWLAGAVENLVQILPQLRPSSSLPSTDIIP